jgi:YbgC/YbaW family acyl-CoA thioester hydrolase
MASRSSFRLLHRLRVRWAEVDMQNIVFNAHYLMYLDVAMTEYWRASALPFAETMAHLQGDMVVRKATLEFHRSAHMDDWVDVGLRLERTGRSSLTFEGALFRGDELLASGELVYVYTTPHAAASQPVAPALQDALQAFEAGQPMTRLQVGGWSELQAHAMPVREAVFAREQRIPMDMVSDAADAQAHHAVVFSRVGLPLATGRLVLQPAAAGEALVAKVGRMAVLHPLRGQGVGAQVLQALVQRARELGCAEVMLHAQQSARSFYLPHGFVQRGDTFEEVGIPHMEMVLAL